MFTLDQANLGTVINTNSAVTSWTVTTSGIAASGSLIVIAFGWYTNLGGTLTSVTAAGGGLTWGVPIVNGLTQSTDACGIAYALAPAGLASGTVLTITGLGGTGWISSPAAAVMSFLGVKSSNPLDGTSSKLYAAISSGAWRGNVIGSMSGNSDLVFSCGWGDSNTATVTSVVPGSGWVAGPLVSHDSAIGGVLTPLYAMNVTSTPNPLAWGTWGTGTPTGAAVTAAAFLPESPPPDPDPALIRYSHTPLRRIS